MLVGMLVAASGDRATTSLHLLMAILLQLKLQKAQP